MSEMSVAYLMLGLLVVVFLTGIELGYGMAILGFIGFGLLTTMEGARTMMGKELLATFSSYGFTVVPLFVLMGQVAFNTGIAKRLYDAAYKFMGHIPGGLALATIAGATMFKAICGSSAATTATFASVSVPEMDRFGYSRKLSGGVATVVGTLGILMPPSAVLIIYGIITEQPIGKLFVAAFLPGLLLAALYAGVIIGWCRINPAIGPRGQAFTWKERRAAIPSIMWPAVIFVIVIAGMMSGFFTPTEAGSVGALAVILLTIFTRDLTFPLFKKSVIESLRTTCMVLMLIAGSSILGRCIAITNTPAMTADWVVQLPLHRAIIMGLICIVYLIGGTFIDDLAFMILATPIFLPSISKLGYDPLWSGIVICLTIMIGSVIPPVAMCVFIVRNITKIPIGIIYKGVYPFLIALVVCTLLLFIFPQIVLYLPSVLTK
jgi:C4-dicarboxylate transporter, DctM subunit